MEIANKEKDHHCEDHTVYGCQYHVIFRPKYRRRVLVPPIDGRLKELILEKQSDYVYKVLEMEVMPDQVYHLIDVNHKRGVYYVVNRRIVISISFF